MGVPGTSSPPLGRGEVGVVVSPSSQMVPALWGPGRKRSAPCGYRKAASTQHLWVPGPGRGDLQCSSEQTHMHTRDTHAAHGCTAHTCTHTHTQVHSGKRWPGHPWMKGGVSPELLPLSSGPVLLPGEGGLRAPPAPPPVYLQHLTHLNYARGRVGARLGRPHGPEASALGATGHPGPPGAAPRPRPLQGPRMSGAAGGPGRGSSLVDA